MLFWDQPIDDSAFALFSDVTPSAFAGDYSGDGNVDAADYILWRKASGQTVTPGTGADGTGNGVVGADDYNLWRANFGRTTPPTESAGTAAIADAVFAGTSAVVNRSAMVDSAASGIRAQPFSQSDLSTFVPPVRAADRPRRSPTDASRTAS